ncbi:hypothetical protein C8R45DRAFT_930592 [Mycena sanguinolenta]|nr:hypothetical protein C8R45DRAFT_930592 [Mycena sanguinolenta]
MWTTTVHIQQILVVALGLLYHRNHAAADVPNAIQPFNIYKIMRGSVQLSKCQGRFPEVKERKHNQIEHSRVGISHESRRDTWGRWAGVEHANLCAVFVFEDLLRTGNSEFGNVPNDTPPARTQGFHLSNKIFLSPNVLGNKFDLKCMGERVNVYWEFETDEYVSGNFDSPK